MMLKVKPERKEANEVYDSSLILMIRSKSGSFKYKTKV